MNPPSSRRGASLIARIASESPWTNELPAGAAADRRPNVSVRSHALSIALILLLGLVAHVWVLWDGLFLDDHWHRLQLEQRGWAIQDLLDTTTIEPAQFIDSWWQDRTVRWEYLRPGAILLMKTVHALSGGSVIAQHAVGLALHLATACMVYALCLLLTAHRGWSTVGGLLFGAYSHATIAVPWLAAQNALLQTALSVAAVLAYIRASGLRPAAAQAIERSAEPTVDHAAERTAPAPPVRRGLLLACIALWTAALLSRENALVLPVIFLALDRAFGGRATVRARRGVYAVFALIGLAFVATRLSLLHARMPDVYLRRPDGLEYPLWLLAKMLHYVCSAVWLSPMTVGPSGRYNPFVEVPGDCALMIAILGVMGSGYYLACRRLRGWWIWPLWIVLAFVPVAPLMAAPHTGYMAGVGFAVAMVLGPALRRDAAPTGIGRLSPGVAIWFLLATHIYIPIYRQLWLSLVNAERVTLSQLAAVPPPAQARHVFFLNLPFVNIYIEPSLRAQGSIGEATRCHVLTYSPDLLRCTDAFRIEQLDAHSFEIATAGRPWFSGYLGRFLLDGMRDGGRLSPGETVSGELFDTTVIEADGEGVRRLRFRFRKPLADPEFVFLVTSAEAAAARIRFASSADLTGNAANAPPLAPPDALRLVAALGGPPPPAFDAWWEVHGSAEALAAVRATAALETERTRRDALYATRRIAAGIIRTDLYVTGPRYPGPR